MAVDLEIRYKTEKIKGAYFNISFGQRSVGQLSYKTSVPVIFILGHLFIIILL